MTATDRTARRDRSRSPAGRSAWPGLAARAPAYGLRARVAAGSSAADPAHGAGARGCPRRHALGARRRRGARRDAARATRRFFARLGADAQDRLRRGLHGRRLDDRPGTDLADVLTPFAERMTSLIPPRCSGCGTLVLPRLLRAEENTRPGAARTSTAHYDLSNEMFEQFLDPTMSYSSACSTLDPPRRWPTRGGPAAQDRRHPGRWPASPRASRVLEIGTGWGALAIRAAAARRRGDHADDLRRAGGPRPAARRRRRGGRPGRRRAARLPRRRPASTTPMVCVEMIEAVGEEYWPTYFSQIDALLAPGGRVGIQAIRSRTTG